MGPMGHMGPTETRRSTANPKPGPRNSLVTGGLELSKARIDANNSRIPSRRNNKGRSDGCPGGLGGKELAPDFQNGLYNASQAASPTNTARYTSIGT
jgi:hypothetical protein